MSRFATQRFGRKITLLFPVLFFAFEVIGAEVIVLNGNDPGEGLNDPTPAAPVGANPGATVGEQRLNVLQRAAEFWSVRLVSSVPIRVVVRFAPLPCDETSAVLGMSGPVEFCRDFAGAPLTNVYYAIALANALAGEDLIPDEDDIDSTFNSELDSASCFSTTHWYYGFDHNPPEDGVDFLNVALHEFAHGLGFLSAVNPATGAKFMGVDDAFTRNLENHLTGKLFPEMTDTERVAASIATGNLHWVGTNVLAMIGILTAGTSGGHVQMYAPDPLEPGSSVSHFDTALSPDELMEPIETPNLDHRLTLESLKDIGWQIIPMIRVAICGAETDFNNFDLKTKIVASGLFSSSQVDLLRVANGGPIPTLAQLRQYNALLVYSNYRFTDPTGMGDALAEYIESGGGVVVATHSFSSDGLSGLAGRIMTAGYLPFTPGVPLFTRHLTLVKDAPDHPILEDVSGFDGGLQSTRDAVTLANGASLIAHWSDGTPMIATTEPTGSHVVGLNFWPPSSDSDFYGWQSGTDGGLLMANALLSSAGEPRTPEIPVCGALTLVSFDDFTAPGDFPETTRLTNRYEAQGVTFSGPGGRDGGAILNADAHFNVTGYSGNNFLALNTAGAMSDGGVPRGPESISFATPMAVVRLLVGSGLDPGHSVTVAAYKANNTLVTNVSVVLSSQMTPVQLIADGIQYLVISTTSPTLVLDDLSFIPACSAPALTSPLNQTVIAGETAAFAVAATGTAPLRYTWQFNGTNLSAGGNILGPTTAHLIISNAQPADAGSYCVVVKNALGSVTSSPATLTVLPYGTPKILAGTLRRDANGRFEFALSGAVGSDYEIQASSDLENWSRLTTLSMTNNPSYCLDPDPTFDRRFYRAVLKRSP